MNRAVGTALVAGFIMFSACSGSEPEPDEAKSMIRIHREEGFPVRVRELQPEEFSVYYKFPAEFKARNESTAYAGINEVVRKTMYKVGDYVKRDEVVVSMSLDNSQYQQAKLNYENAHNVFRRTRELYADAGVSQQEYENVQTQYKLARETFNSISELIEVQAPIDGYITQMNAQVSANVRPGEVLFTVSNLDGYEAVFYISTGEIDRIKTGAAAVIEDCTETLHGSVSEIALNMDPKKKAFLARAYFPGKPRCLVSGMSLDVAVEAYRNDAAIVVSRDELVRSGDGWIAYVAEGNRAAQRRIIPGRDRNLEFEVMEGLHLRDLLIIEGGGELSDDTAIKIVNAVSANQGK